MNEIERRELQAKIAANFKQAMRNAQSDGEEYAVAYAARLVAKTVGVTDHEWYNEACGVTTWARGRWSDLVMPEEMTR